MDAGLQSLTNAAVLPKPYDFEGLRRTVEKLAVLRR